MDSAVETRDGELTPDTSRALGERLGDKPRMAALRAEAAREAGHRSMPTSVERPWKYYDASTLDLSAYRPAVGAIDRRAAEVRSCPVTGEHAAVIAFQNGEAVFTEDAPEGLTLAAFDAVDPDVAAGKALADRLGSAVPFARNKLTALHYAFLRGGVLVHLAPNVELHEPVRILREYVSDKQLATPHTLIVTGANSRLSVIEDYRSAEDADVVALPAAEILPGPGSTVRYTALHRWGAKTRVFGEQCTVTERDSALIGLSLVTGGAVVKSHIESSLVGRGSSSELFALGVGRGRQHTDFFTLQDHIGPDTRSDLLFKSALKDRSRAVYYGLTRVGLGARNADANQENRNLILSKGARADSDPVLEILTNDVIRVSHGATAGPVDEEQLFYLQARAIPRLDAEALLVRGFLSQVLDRVPDEALRDELAQALDARMGQA
ncbi:MAG: SufD family Fe-S cluster assembly protein [Chloroflexi bacterium]|nr:SufD family Fe-S cluster assembly protein [Chloroflexota bacterium]